jgi:transposase
MNYFIGIDLHRKYSQVCALRADGREEIQKKLYHDDVEALKRFFGHFAEDTPVTMEPTTEWMWMGDLLEGMGMEVHLAHSVKVRLIAESRLKTDKIDCRVLAQLLRTGFLPEAYLAPPSVRDRRMLLRHREGMVRHRTAHKNRVHGLLARYNVHLEASDIFGKAGMDMLKTLELPRHARRVLDDLLDCIEYYNGEIKRTEAYLRETLEPDRRIPWLTSLPGVGKLTAYYLVAEIGDITRFLSPKKLVSYAGLCPTTRSSGGKTYHGPPRGGRRLLKWVLVEAAHTAARRDSYFGSFFRRLKRKKGKQTAYVATARKMAQVIWHMLTEGRPYRPKTQQSQAGSSWAMAVR